MHCSSAVSQSFFLGVWGSLLGNKKAQQSFGYVPAGVIRTDTTTTGYIPVPHFADGRSHLITEQTRS